MFISVTPFQKSSRFLAAALVALFAGGTAHAAGYEFNKLLPGGGGGGGTDPAKRRIVSSRGAHICLDVSESPGNQVRFTLWSEVPEPNSRLASVNFETGRHADLIDGLVVAFQSPGVKSTVISPRRDASNRNASMRYVVQFPYEYPQGGSSSGFKVRGGVAPGNIVVMSAKLGPGQTFAGVIGALHEAFNPATEASGLRIWVTGHYFLGGPPPGVGTINDDATFMVSGVSPRCQRR